MMMEWVNDKLLMLESCPLIFTYFEIVGIGGMVVNPKDDPYLRDLDDDEKSDIEDFNIKPTDNLILVGHVEGNAAVLEVYGTIS